MKDFMIYLTIVAFTTLIWFLLYEFVPAWRSFKVRLTVYVILFGFWAGSIVVRMLS